MGLKNYNMPNPIRIQRSRQHIQVSPNGLPIKYVGRGSKYGNPFKVVQLPNKKWHITITYGTICQREILNHCIVEYDTKEDAVRCCIVCYCWWLLPYQHHGCSVTEFLESSAMLESIVHDLKGCNLSCWCKLSEKCHADILLSWANK